MRFRLHHIVALLFIIGGVFTLQAIFAQQSKRDLEKKREKLLKEIAETNRQLKQTEKNKNATQAQLEMLRKKINLRNDLINSINT